NSTVIGPRKPRKNSNWIYCSAASSSRTFFANSVWGYLAIRTSPICLRSSNSVPQPYLSQPVDSNAMNSDSGMRGSAGDRSAHSKAYIARYGGAFPISVSFTLSDFADANAPADKNCGGFRSDTSIDEPVSAAQA